MKFLNEDKDPHNSFETSKKFNWRRKKIGLKKNNGD